MCKTKGILYYNPKTRGMPKDLRRIGLEESYLLNRIKG